jgi:hypothetical protein
VPLDAVLLAREETDVLERIVGATVPGERAQSLAPLQE